MGFTPQSYNLGLVFFRNFAVFLPRAAESEKLQSWLLPRFVHCYQIVRCEE